MTASFEMGRGCKHIDNSHALRYDERNPFLGWEGVYADRPARRIHRSL